MTREAKHDLRADRARYCYADVATWNQQWFSEAAKRVQGLPVEIRSQGIMVALATLMGENKNSSRHLADTLASWLLLDAGYLVLAGSEESGPVSSAALLKACAGAARSNYVAAQREAMLFFDQVKIYANALAPAEG